MLKSKIEISRDKLAGRCLLSEILKGLIELESKEKVGYDIEMTDYYFKLELSNGDKMTYINLNLYDIRDKIKSYLYKKYNIEMLDRTEDFLKVKDEFSGVPDEKILEYKKNYRYLDNKKINL